MGTSANVKPVHNGQTRGNQFGSGRRRSARAYNQGDLSKPVLSERDFKNLDNNFNSKSLTLVLKSRWCLHNGTTLFIRILASECRKRVSEYYLFRNTIEPFRYVQRVKAKAGGIRDPGW